MAKSSKEEQEEERKKELLRTLRRGPNLDRFIDEQTMNWLNRSVKAADSCIGIFAW